MDDSLQVSIFLKSCVTTERKQMKANYVSI